MFCRQCGMPMPEGGVFCRHCGTAFIAIDDSADEPPPGAAPQPDTGEPLMTLRPQFILREKLMALALPACLVGALFGPIPGGVVFGLLDNAGYDVVVWKPFVFSAVAAALIVPLVALWVTRKRYAQTEYRFYRHRLEYSEGFWTVEKKRIAYDTVTEITMRRGIAQKPYGLGTLFIATPAAAGIDAQGRLRSGIKLADIANPAPLYDALRRLTGIVPRDTPPTAEPRLVLRPVARYWMPTPKTVPLLLMVVFVGGLLLGGAGMEAIRAFSLPIPLWLPFLIAMPLLGSAAPMPEYIYKKMAYAQTEYRFYHDRLEYAEGFWMAEDKSVPYRQITEVSMHRRILQKRYGLGTLLLATPATGFSAQGRAHSGVIVADIENTKALYGEVRAIVRQNAGG